MNKADFIKELESRTEYTAERCVIINDVLENHFIFRKKNKPTVVADIAEKLSIDNDEADSLYELCMNIIRSEKKCVLKRPFGSNRK